MKRKNNPPKEDVKKEIIIKSREIISKMGYKKSSTEEIARSLNKTKGALYHYFENREEIIKEVLKYEGQLVKEAVSEALVKEKEPDKQLHSFFLIRARQVYELWSFYQSVIAEYFNRYSFIMSTLSEYTSEEQSILEGILRDGNRKKVFNVKNVRLTSSALIKAMRGYDFFMFQGVRFEDIEDEYNLMRYFMVGVAPNWSSMDSDSKNRYVNNFWQNMAAKSQMSEDDIMKLVDDRVKYANKNYSSLRAGWTSDMGRIYIRNGAPADIETGTSSDDTRFVRKDYQIWKYNSGTKPVYLFIDIQMNNNYRLYYVKGDTMENSNPDYKSYLGNEFDDSLLRN